ncbi:MAG: DUF6178 family protein [Desulfuromonadales bacterium]|nr:DUF6178 family protein [Desulfuromonadales bacterium]
MPMNPSLSSPSLPEFARMGLPAQLDVLRLTDFRQRARYLLESSHGAELMARLPVQDAFLMFKVLGAENYPELLELLSAEQWTGFFDLDCWVKDRFDSDKARVWLSYLLETEPEQIVATLLQLDFELLVLLIRKEVTILAGPEQIEDEEELQEAMRSDGGYLLDFRDEDGAKLFGSLFALLFGMTPDFYRYLMSAVHAETESLIEESVYQQRAARMTDWGFCEPFGAGSVYAWLDPHKYLELQHGKQPLGVVEVGAAPGFSLQFRVNGGLLAELLAQGISEEQAWELTALTNKVLLADQIDPGDADRVARSVRQVHATLNLALDWLADNDLNRAEKWLADCYLEDLFRVGFSLTLLLQRRAAKIVDSKIFPYLDPQQRFFLSALRRRPPQLPVSLVEVDQDGTREFASRQELLRAERLLDRLELLEQLFTKTYVFDLPAAADLDLAECQPTAAEELTLAHLFLTALANHVLGREFVPVPIHVADMVALHGMVSIDGRLNEDLARETEAWLENLLPGAGFFAGECLELWREGFCAVPVEQLDARFVSGLIVKN